LKHYKRFTQNNITPPSLPPLPQYGINTADYTPYIHNIHLQGTKTWKRETIYIRTVSTKETLQYNTKKYKIK
jgi:hypothetical protein